MTYREKVKPVEPPPKPREPPQRVEPVAEWTRGPKSGTHPVAMLVILVILVGISVSAIVVLRGHL